MWTICRSGRSRGRQLQRLPLDVLHDDERAVVSVADLVSLADERTLLRWHIAGVWQ
jgi:hypothetical protein